MNRREELSTKLSALLTEYADFAEECQIPVVDDWVTVVSISDAADPDGGMTHMFYEPHQWKYRSAGLIESALDKLRARE